MQFLLLIQGHLDYNPVRVGFAKRPEDRKWSSAGAHMDNTSYTGKFMQTILFLTKSSMCITIMYTLKREV